ncbi:MAG: response regulator [Deltaproteobacteria bacterium]|nr:response regulator [Deltaproteobacteria bacterium]
MSEPSILIVDDDVNTRELLREILERRGYKSITCENGEQALSELEHIPAPSVILLDLDMPVMNGYEFRVAQRERVEISSVPVVVMSAGRQIDRVTLGDVEYLPKPFTTEALLKRIRGASEQRLRSSPLVSRETADPFGAGSA